MPRKRTGHIQQRSKTSFRIRYVDADGIRQQETIKGTQADAERELAIRLGELAAGIPVSSKPNTVTFAELANDVVTDYEVNKFASVDDIEARFRLHIIPAFGNRKAAQITTAQIKHYILLRQKDGAKTGTINRELEAMRHTFKLAIKGRKLLVAPHVPKLREDNVREGFFTREEVERVCSFLSENLAAFVWFAFLTGWRVGEIRKLQWSAVDFAHNEIRIGVGKDKNRKGRVFPMSDDLRALLDRLWTARTIKDRANHATIGGVVAMPAPLTNAPVFSLGEFRKSWATACHKAGLPCVVRPIVCKGKPVLDAEGKPKVKIVKCLRTPHDLRRSFAREMDIQGMRRGAIKALAGWKTDSVFNRYNIVSEADLRTEIQRLDEAKRAVNGAKEPKRLRRDRRKPAPDQ